MLRQHLLYLLLLAAGALVACSSAPTPPTPAMTVATQARTAMASANRAGHQQRWEDAAVQWQIALTLFQSADDWNGQGEARLGLANAQARLHQSQQVISTLSAMNSPLFSKAQRAQATYQLALLAMPDAHAATALLQQSQTLCGADCAIAPQLSNLAARIRLQQGDAAGALQLANAVLAQGDALPVAERAHALRLIAQSHLVQGQPAAGWQTLQQGLALDRTLANPAWLADDFALQLELARALADQSLQADAQARLTSVCATTDAPACTGVRAP
ncbi:hypothetical protein HNQ50_000747 [Silvimonas terrae]|uniref:Tetratricopeptide repeat protein n=1 Tax=Silvimonas terrae TaxID=300266 RepID=A0A840RAV3_9NEIS|nr:hypothetical protein [Silvimonas terrae]MBB5190037.1 hypothetical protein [Silvimonas terrae]